MKPAITLTTAAAFLLHMLLGCCLHHAHVAQETACEHANEAGHSHAGHDHATKSPDDDSHAEAPDSEDHCTGTHCVFLSGGKAPLTKVTTLALLPAFTSEAVASLYAISIIKFIDTGGLEPPVRLHLFNQVLLI